MTPNTNNAAGNTPKAAIGSAGNTASTANGNHGPAGQGLPTAHSPTATPGTFNDPGNSTSLNSHFMSGVAHQTSGPGLSPAPAIQPRTYNMAQGSILGEHSVSTIGSGNEPQDLQKLLYGKPGESEEQFKQTDLPAMMKRLQPGNRLTSRVLPEHCT